MGGISRGSGGPLKKKERGEEGAPIAELYAIIAVFVSPDLPILKNLLTIFIRLQMFPGIEFLHILRNLQPPESPES